MFELFVGREAVRRHVEGPLTPDGDGPRRRIRRERPRRTRVVRVRSAAVLRNLAERLEASPSR
jgi:hypothetical protein